MLPARLKLAQMVSKKKPVTAKAAMKRSVDIPLSTEMIDWLDDAVNARDEDGFGSEAVTSILTQPLDSESVYCPVSSIISSKLSAPRVPSPVSKTNNSILLSSTTGMWKKNNLADAIVMERPKSVQCSASVKDAVDRMNVLWLQRRAEFEREEGDVEQSIKTIGEALSVHLGTEDYSNAKLADNVVGGTGEELFKHIEKEYFLYDKETHQVASRLQAFYHKHHMKRGKLATLIASTFRMYIAKRNWRRRNHLRNQCALLIQWRFRKHLERINRLAAKIQTWWRLRGAYWEYQRLLRIYRGARCIQRLWRGLKGRIKAYNKAVELYMVKKIQRFARGYIFRRDRGFYMSLFHKLFYRAAVRIQCLGRRIQAIKRSKMQLLSEIAREDGRIAREKSMIAETIVIETRKTRMYLQTGAGKLHFKDTLEAIKARDEYFQFIEPELSTAERLARKALVAFELFDTDGSGYIDELKLRMLLRQLCIPMDDETLHQLFGDMDKFNTGEIDFNEFLDWYCNSNGGMSGGNINFKLKIAEEKMALNGAALNEAGTYMTDAEIEEANMVAGAVAALSDEQKKAKGNKKKGLSHRLASTITRSVECLMRLRKSAQEASGSTLALRAEREILRQSTQWLTRDAIAAFRVTCAPKFHCCQCLKPFVLFTDYYMHFNRKTGYCTVMEEQGLFYPQYWKKHAWDKQRQCEYEIISLNNEAPKLEHYKVMAIYNELALQQNAKYAKILKSYEAVAQRMYVHIMNPSFDDAMKHKMVNRKHAQEDARVAQSDMARTVAALGGPGGPGSPDSVSEFLTKTPADIETEEDEIVRDSANKEKKGKDKKDKSDKKGKGKKDKSDKKGKDKSDKDKKSKDKSDKDKKGKDKSDKGKKNKKGKGDKGDKKGKKLADPESESDAPVEPAADETPAVDPVLVVPLPPTMKELILKIADANIVTDTHMKSSHVMACISKYIKCKLPVGWIAANQYPMSEVLEWLIQEVDERVALERPCWVLTKRGKLKRDALLVGRVHVYVNRIYQVALEEALVTLLNNRLIRPRKMKIDDAELVKLGLTKLTKRAYCDSSISIVRQLDKINRQIYKLYVPKPKPLAYPLKTSDVNIWNIIRSNETYSSLSAFRTGFNQVGKKLLLGGSNAAILCKRIFVFMFGRYMMYAQVGVLGGTETINPDVINDYLLEENHARAYAKLNNRFGTSSGKDHLRRLANELWASRRLLDDRYHQRGYHFKNKKKRNNNIRCQYELEQGLRVPLESGASDGVVTPQFVEDREIEDEFSVEHLREMLDYMTEDKYRHHRGLFVYIYKRLFCRETTVHDAQDRISKLRYVYELIASEFAPKHRQGIDAVDFEVLEAKKGLHIKEYQRGELKPILDPRNIKKSDFTTIAKWLYAKDSGVMNHFWTYLRYFSVTNLFKSKTYNAIMYLTGSTYFNDAKLKLVMNERILSRLEGDLRQLLLHRMHDDDYILNMGNYAPKTESKPSRHGDELNDTVEVPKVNTSHGVVVEPGATDANTNAVDEEPKVASDLPNAVSVGGGELSPVSSNVKTSNGLAPLNENANAGAESSAVGAAGDVHSTIGYGSNGNGEVEPTPGGEDGMEPEPEPEHQDPFDNMDVPLPSLIDMNEADDYLMKTQIDHMKNDDEAGETMIVYRQAEEKAERDFKRCVYSMQNNYEIKTEALLIEASRDMIRTYSSCITNHAPKPRLTPWTQIVARKCRNAMRFCIHGIENTVVDCFRPCVHVNDATDDDTFQMENEEDEVEYEMGWDLTLSILICTFDTDASGNFDEGEIRLLLECCKKPLSEKEILYFFPQVKDGSVTTEAIGTYLAPRVKWKMASNFHVGNKKYRDQGLLGINTTNIYSTALKCLTSLNRQIALENAKQANTLAKSGKLMLEVDDEKDSACLVTRCQLLAMRQVHVYMRTHFGVFHRLILRKDDIEIWWKKYVIDMKFSMRGILQYACHVFSEEHTKPVVLITEIPYIIRFLMERFDMIRWGDMSHIASMVFTAMKYVHKLVYIPIEKVVKLLKPCLKFSIVRDDIISRARKSFSNKAQDMNDTEEDISKLGEHDSIPWKLWELKKMKPKYLEQDTNARILSMARGQAIQIAFNFPNLYVADTNYRCLILGVSQLMSVNKKTLKKQKEIKLESERKRRKEYNIRNGINEEEAMALEKKRENYVKNQKVLHNLNGPQHGDNAVKSKNILLKEASFLFLLSRGYTMNDLCTKEVRQVIVSTHPNGSITMDTIDKDRVEFWGRRSQAIHLNRIQSLDRWRRYFLYNIYWYSQYKSFCHILEEYKMEADVIAANFLKEIMTGISHCVNKD